MLRSGDARAAANAHGAACVHRHRLARGTSAGALAQCTGAGGWYSARASEGSCVSSGESFVRAMCSTQTSADSRPPRLEGGGQLGDGPNCVCARAHTHLRACVRVLLCGVCAHARGLVCVSVCEGGVRVRACACLCMGACACVRARVGWSACACVSVRTCQCACV